MEGVSRKMEKSVFCQKTPGEEPEGQIGKKWHGTGDRDDKGAAIESPESSTGKMPEANRMLSATK